MEGKFKMIGDMTAGFILGIMLCFILLLFFVFLPYSSNMTNSTEIQYIVNVPTPWQGGNSVPVQFNTNYICKSNGTVCVVRSDGKVVGSEKSAEAAKSNIVKNKTFEPKQ